MSWSDMVPVPKESGRMGSGRLRAARSHADEVDWVVRAVGEREQGDAKKPSWMVWAGRGEMRA